MAKITLQIGQITAEINATDQKAARVLRGLLLQNGYDVEGMTNQQQANEVITLIARFITESATAHEATDAAEAARRGALENPPTFD